MGPICEADVRKLILDEPTHIVDSLPRGMCQGDLKKRSYTTLDDSLFTCDINASGEPSTDVSTEPVTEAPSDTSSPSDQVTQSPSVLEVEDDDESFASQICVSMLLFF